MSIITGGHLLTDPPMVIPVEFSTASNGKIECCAIIPENCLLISMECYDSNNMRTFSLSNINKAVMAGDTFRYVIELS